MTLPATAAQASVWATMCQDPRRRTARQPRKCCTAAYPGTLSQLVRTALVPKLGYKFVDARLSAIEARVVAWLAGEKWVLQVFRTHDKIYEATAIPYTRVHYQG